MDTTSAPTPYMGPVRPPYQMYRELTRSVFETILTRIGCRHRGGIPAEVFFNGCAEEIMVTTKDLEAFFRDGWNRHDVDLLMTFMSDQCVFETTAGSEACGTRHRGRERVREAFAKVFSVFPDARFGDAAASVTFISIHADLKPLADIIIVRITKMPMALITRAALSKRECQLQDEIVHGA